MTWRLQCKFVYVSRSLRCNTGTLAVYQLLSIKHWHGPTASWDEEDLKKNIDFNLVDKKGQKNVDKVSLHLMSCIV